ncbi:hypothetical protein QYE76_009271 [Lolium multiflorum]|uniref:Retrotransposon gag domain-containing protein n=1 Tax=Lolium multiflorum TaxID=4521 RepID=A0AAD8TV42_LOLMU|nr:hypothetical protein QYE76_009271 [Lolium multiflorum]
MASEEQLEEHYNRHFFRTEEDAEAAGVGGDEDHEMEDDAGGSGDEPSGNEASDAAGGSTYAPSGDEATGAAGGGGETSGDDPSGAAGSSGTGTSGSKRPRKARRQNTVGTGRDTVKEVDPASGLPVEPKDVAKGYGNQLACILREVVNLNETDLRAESKAPLRAQLIARLHSRYKFLGDYASTDQTKNIVNSQALLKFTKHLSSYKYMVRKLIAEGKGFEEVHSAFPHVSQADFDAFVANEELQATKNRKLWGKEMRELNIGNHNLGSRGYEGKEPYWAKEDEAYVNAGIENPWLKYKDPLERRFIRSRYHKKKLTGELVTDPKVVTDIIWFTNDKKVLALEKKLEEERQKLSQCDEGSSSQASTGRVAWDKPLMTEGAKRGRERSHCGPRPQGGAAQGLAAPPCALGAPQPLSPPFLRVLLRPENLSHREDLTKGYSRLCGAENTREKRALRRAGIRRGNSLPEGEIDAIAIVIERDIISIIIIIISTIYTAITTAAPRISMNEVRKKLFTISLSGKAAHWYKLLKNGDSIDWEDIVPLFYSKFYPPSEIHKDRNRIYNFWPHDGESIAQAWGRLKSLMLKCPIHELPGNVIIDNFYARLSFQDKTLLDTSCSGSFTRKNEEFKRDLLDRIQENTEGWENDKDRESGIIYDYKCIEVFMDTDKFRNMSATYGLDSQVVANLYKAFASHYELPKKNFDKYHEPYKDKVDSSVNKCVVVETVDNVIPEAYIEKTPFPAKMKEYSVISSAVNKSEKKPKEPEEQIKIEPAVAIVKDLVTENVEDGHIIFCEDASNIVSHPNKSKQVSVPMLSVRIGDHCYYGLCDIGASVSAIPYELYTEIMHEIGSCELEDIDVVIHLANRETISPIGIVRDVEVLCATFGE